MHLAPRQGVFCAFFELLRTKTSENMAQVRKILCCVYFVSGIYVLETLNLCNQYVKLCKNGNFLCELVREITKITYLASLKTP